MIAGCFLGLTAQINAAQCFGGTPVYWCTPQIFSDGIESADFNCCAGSAVHFYNPCTGQTYIHDVLEDGPNSSCAIPE